MPNRKNPSPREKALMKAMVSVSKFCVRDSLLFSLIHRIGQPQIIISQGFSPDGTSSVSLRLLPSPQEKALGMCRTARTKKAFHVLGRRLGCVRGRSLKSFLVLGRRPRARGCRPVYTTRRQECFCLCCPSRFLCYVSVIFMFLCYL